MENKPIVTCHGDQTLFAKLHPAVLQGLPREPVEWRRSYGRPPRTIYVEATFVPYNPDIVPGDDDWTLLGRPFFHTYWVDCDIDLYKSSIKEEIGEWLNELKAKNITDWMIIVVVNEESKVKTKILRTSVYDKIKSDFCNKQTDRCVVLTEPFKPDLKSGESWGGLLSRMRQLLLQSYNRHLGRFEEYMRAQRERRTEKGWNFCQYFMLQEELAFMFEMLGLYEDSLVQYDELDALFTQFVLNHAAGDRATWLMNFHRIQCSSWDGLCLSQPINIEKRQLIKRNQPSLLDFRNYLFSRQCTLLFLLIRPWEVAQRSIPFMHNCMKELDILQITLPPGAIACWVFLSCLEVLRTCDKFSDAGHMDAHSLYTANLREYARKKMHELGLLCGLMPDLQPSSEQLSLVVDLIGGLGHQPGNSEPLEKLKEAVSSKAAFHKRYLELSELAMGTYKHIGRIRSARLIGKDLATFYMKLGEPQHAEGFLMDALKTYKQEGWEMLADHTRLDLADCHRTLDNHTKYVKTCVHIAASPILNADKRRFHQKGMVELARNELEEVEYVRCRPVFLLNTATPTQESFVLNTECSVKLNITVNLLEPIHCDVISLSLVCQPLHTDQPDGARFSAARRISQSSRGRTRHESTSSTSGINFYNHVSHVTKLAPSSIELQLYYERKSDKSVTTCGLQSKASLRRTDSGCSHQMVEVEVQKEEFGVCLQLVDVELKPGENTVVLTGRPTEKGQYQLSQLCVKVGRLEFLKSVTPMGVSFAVVKDLPTFHIQPVGGCFYAGIPQEAMLTFHSGSYAFDTDLPVTLNLPAGLTLTGDDVGEDGVVHLAPSRPYHSQEFKVEVFAMPNVECADETQYKVKLECSALEEPTLCVLDFEPSLKVSHKVHTSHKKKYIQLVVHGRDDLVFELSDHTLTADSRDVELLPMNKPEQTMTVDADCSASYMWQLKSNVAESPPLRCTFCVTYKQGASDTDSKPRKWSCPFTIQDYKTLYTVKSEVAPPDGQETCTAGALCQLALKVRCLDGACTDAASLMYEILPDDKNWALSGKTSGVFQLEGKQYQTNLGVMPLVGGYLPVPRIKLVMYNSGTQSTEETGGHKDKEDAKEQTSSDEETMPELIPFATAQVYNASLASQVRVLPAVNTSFVDITVAE